jgi:hypothetical protein
VILRFGDDPSFIPPFGKQLLKSDAGFPVKEHSAKTERVLMASIQRIQNIFFILIDIETGQKGDNKICKRN